MRLAEVNSWWKRGIAKERARLVNTPKAPKGDRFSTPTNFSNFAKTPKESR